MTDSNASPNAPAASKKLPGNAWTPGPGASIVVYWSRLDDDQFDVALQLLDPSVLADSDPGIIVWVTMGPDRARQAFSLRDETSPERLLSGRFEWRQVGLEVPQLWLINATYPDGYTAEAQIA